MSNILKFPQGYDVVVCKKEDVLATIDQNILDKDLAIAIIEQIEVDATRFLQEGRWIGIPYIGNIRHNRYYQKIKSKEYKELIKTAREELDKDKYILFRKQLNTDIGKAINIERFNNYNASKFVTRNLKFYKYMRKTRGELAAKIIAYTCCTMEFWNQDDMFL
jgi:hypothetical protein